MAEELEKTGITVNVLTLGGLTRAAGVGRHAAGMDGVLLSRFTANMRENLRLKLKHPWGSPVLLGLASVSDIGLQTGAPARHAGNFPARPAQRVTS